ncbi:Protein kinase, putative [Hondaea fermentalgiana]|uniref:Protein kinase, putative n=1 Tax=Hondaea fermentalgiana TaxID=2315210 RepID=A0A2R5GI25_9STRA|nr:Protein kinase, putative [Hondaea fermentalgiana]|eukprot:GBG27941.1 Protein kinase, putative [Hondaea fermentalgiana]
MEHGSPSLRQIRGIAKEITGGIRFLHENQIIHGDIKPENIGIAEDGHIRIFDFGLATIVQADEEGRLCKIVSPYGTTAYSSPEKLQGKPHGFEVDWWGFAVVLFELAHDELPWLGSTPEETCSLICEAPLCIPGDEETVAEHEELDNEEEACNDLLHEMLAFKDPEERLGYHEGWREVSAHPFLLDEDL